MWGTFVRAIVSLCPSRPTGGVAQADRLEQLQALGHLIHALCLGGQALQDDRVEHRGSKLGPAVQVRSLGHDGGVQNLPREAADVGAGEGVIPGQPEDVEGVGHRGVARVVEEEDLGIAAVVDLHRLAKGAVFQRRSGVSGGQGGLVTGPVDPLARLLGIERRLPPQPVQGPGGHVQLDGQTVDDLPPRIQSQAPEQLGELGLGQRDSGAEFAEGQSAREIAFARRFEPGAVGAANVVRDRSELAAGACRCRLGGRHLRLEGRRHGAPSSSSGTAATRWPEAGVLRERAA